MPGWADEFYARTEASGRTYFLADAVGSTIGLTNTAGNLVQSYHYDPYGEVTAQNTGFTNPYQYTGRENDGNGLYYYRARYYNPVMKRFIGEDPLGFGGGQPNFYAYVGNNPLSGVDPLGLCDENDRCKKVKEDALELCSDSSLPTGDRGFRFWNCVNAYIEAQGCGPGGNPLPQPDESPAIPPPDESPRES